MRGTHGIAHSFVFHRSEATYSQDGAKKLAANDEARQALHALQHGNERELGADEREVSTPVVPLLLCADGMTVHWLCIDCTLTVH